MKQRIAIIFGGKSGEHEVSVNSALSIETNIDRNLFDTVAIGITQTGSWVTAPTIAELVKDGRVMAVGGETLPPATVVSQLLTADTVFPIIHGTTGEDGSLQGLLEMANLAFVGSRVLGSALAMDKVIQKQLCAQAGIPQTNYLAFTRREWQESPDKMTAKINESLHLPLFVKPANLGSSVGISKVKTPADLTAAIELALKYDQKIIIEQGVENIMEIEVAILGNDQPQASICGSIEPNTEFYDYETKYLTDDVVATIPAPISPEISTQVQQAALKAYQTLNCQGLARIDFFYQKDQNKIVLNEINTLPGFTSISMYPKLWTASGISYQNLITRLIELGREAWENRQKLQYVH